MEYLLLLLLSVLYLKWIFIIMTLPWVCLLFLFRKRGGMLYKIFAIPGFIIEKVTREGASRYIIINIGNIPSITLRISLYRMLGVDVAKNVDIHYKTEIRTPYNLHIGKGSIIGDNALLDARNGLQMGENVNISSNVSIYTEQHDHRDEHFRCTEGQDKSVTIGDRVWLGSNVTVLPGVKIGEGAVCCAGCVVTKDVAPFEVVAGIPAKKVNIRPQSLSYEFDGSTCWFY